MTLLKCRIPAKNVYIIHDLGNKLQINLVFHELLLALFFFFLTFANDWKAGLERDQQYWLDYNLSLIHI